MRTLILMLICSAFMGGAVMDAHTKGKNRATLLRHALVGFVIGMFVCWFLVRVVGIFDQWHSPWR